MKTGRYMHRDEKGVLKAIYPADLAAEITFNTTGHWRSYKIKDKPETRCFQFDDDNTMNVRGNLMTIFFWKGDFIVEEVCGSPNELLRSCNVFMKLLTC